MITKISNITTSTRINPATGKKQYRFSFRYTLSTGETKQKKGKWEPTKKAALQAAELYIEELNKEHDRSLITLEETAVELYREKALNNSTKTMKEKRSILSRVFPDLLSMPIDEITPLMIRKALARQADKSWRTKEKYRINLHEVFAYACQYYNLKENPVDRIEHFHKPKIEDTDIDDDSWETKDTIKVVSLEDFQKFLLYMDDQEYADLYQWLYWTGLRRSEALSLTFSEIKDGVMRIRKAWDVTDQKFKRLKNDSSIRLVRLPKILIQIYERQLDRYKNEPAFDPKTWFLFGGYKPLTRSTMDRKRKAAIKLADIPYFTNHDLRHSYASNLLAIEKNEFLVSRSLGHSNTQITESTYAHVPVSDFSDELDALANLSA